MAEKPFISQIYKGIVSGAFDADKLMRVKTLEVLEEQLIGHVQQWKDCTRCPLGCRAQHHVLFEIIPKDARRLDVLFVGEAPGMMEDIKGYPFVGKSGILMRGIIRQAYLSGISYGFTNTVACKTVDAIGGANRQPLPEEIEACEPRIISLVRIYRPKIVVLVGAVARDNVGHSLKESGYKGVLKNIVHPAYILRTRKDDTQEKEIVAKIKEIFRQARSMN